MTYWKLLDFVNEGGRNEIKAWLQELRPAIRARLQTRLQYYAAMPRLSMPHARVRTAEGDGLLELRIDLDNVQYRPLGYYGPQQRDITLLIGAIGTE